MKHHDMSKVENMMLNIHEEGEETMLEFIEHILDPVDRFQQRNLYYFALEKMKGK